MSFEMPQQVTETPEKMEEELERRSVRMTVHDLQGKDGKPDETLRGQVQGRMEQLSTQNPNNRGTYNENNGVVVFVPKYDLDDAFYVLKSTDDVRDKLHRMGFTRNSAAYVPDMNGDTTFTENKGLMDDWRAKSEK